MHVHISGQLARVLKHALRAVFLLLAVLLLGGCRLTLAVDVDLDGDGGGTLAVSLTADAALSEEASAAGVDPLGRMAERVRAMDDGWRVRDEVDEVDGSRVVELTSGFADPAGFAEQYAQIAAALDAPEATLLGPLAVTVDEESDTVGVSGSSAIRVTEVAAADLGSDVTTLTDELQGVVETRLSIRTPGTVLRTDGTVVLEDPEAEEGPATVTWTVTPGSEVEVDLMAERGGSDLLLWLLTTGGAVVALLLVVGGVLAQRRR